MRREITINEPFEARTAHTSVTCKSEPIKHVFDDRALGEGPAKAIAKAIADGIRAVGATATKATLERRGRAHRSAPATHNAGSARLFNGAGRLAELALRAAGDAWEILVPGDRLNDFTPANLRRFIDRLRELVPALRAPLEHPDVRAAIEKTLRKIFVR